MVNFALIVSLCTIYKTHNLHCYLEKKVSYFNILDNIYTDANISVRGKYQPITHFNIPSIQIWKDKICKWWL